MKPAYTFELANLFQSVLPKEKAERLAEILSDDNDQVEQLRKNFATKEDLISMELRLTQKMDSNFKALVAIMFTLVALAVTLSKLL